MKNIIKRITSKYSKYFNVFLFGFVFLITSVVQNTYLWGGILGGIEGESQFQCDILLAFDILVSPRLQISNVELSAQKFMESTIDFRLQQLKTFHSAYTKLDARSFESTAAPYTYEDYIKYISDSNSVKTLGLGPLKPAILNSIAQILHIKKVLLEGTFYPIGNGFTQKGFDSSLVKSKIPKEVANRIWTESKLDIVLINLRKSLIGTLEEQIDSSKPYAFISKLIAVILVVNDVHFWIQSASITGYVGVNSLLEDANYIVKGISEQLKMFSNAPLTAEYSEYSNRYESYFKEGNWILPVIYDLNENQISALRSLGVYAVSLPSQNGSFLV